MFIKLSPIWKIYEEKDLMYISNSINGELFEIFDNKRKSIIHSILNKESLDTIKLEYGTKWEEFKEELESNFMIYYSENKFGYNDEVSLGNNLMKSAKFSAIPPQITDLYVNFTYDCDEDCKECSNNMGVRPCLSCKKKDTKYESTINPRYLKEALLKFKDLGISNIIIKGGDPFIYFNDLIKLVNTSKKLIPNITIYILSNSKQLGKYSNDELKKLSNLNINIIIEKINSNFSKETIDKLIQNQIKFDFFDRFKADNLESSNQEVLFNKNNITKSINLIQKNELYVKNRCYNRKITLDFNGNIYICDGYDEILGNIVNDQISKIVKNIERMYLTEELPDKCKKCGLSDLCDGCLYLRNSMDKKYEFNDVCKN